MDYDQDQTSYQDPSTDPIGSTTTTSTPPTELRPEQNGFAIASLILGVVSIVLCCCSCTTPITASLAIIFALLSRQGHPMDKKAISGLVCGIISLVLAVALIALSVTVVINSADEVTDIIQEIEDGNYPYDFDDSFFPHEPPQTDGEFGGEFGGEPDGGIGGDMSGTIG